MFLNIPERSCVFFQLPAPRTRNRVFAYKQLQAYEQFPANGFHQQFVIHQFTQATFQFRIAFQGEKHARTVFLGIQNHAVQRVFRCYSFIRSRRVRGCVFQHRVECTVRRTYRQLLAVLQQAFGYFADARKSVIQLGQLTANVSQFGRFAYFGRSGFGGRRRGYAQKGFQPLRQQAVPRGRLWRRGLGRSGCRSSVVPEACLILRGHDAQSYLLLVVRRVFCGCVLVVCQQAKHRFAILCFLQLLRVRVHQCVQRLQCLVAKRVDARANIRHHFGHGFFFECLARANVANRVFHRPKQCFVLRVTRFHHLFQCMLRLILYL